MLRAGKKLPNIRILLKNSTKSPYCTPAEPTPKKGKLGVTLKLLGLTALGGSGVVAYSWYDNDFKKKITDNIPYSDLALDYLLQNVPPVDELKAKLPSLPSIPEMPKLPWQTSENKDLPPEKGLAKVIRPDMSQIKEEAPKPSTKTESLKNVAKTGEVPPASTKKIREEPRKEEKEMETKKKEKPIEPDTKKTTANQAKDTELDDAVENAALASVIKLSIDDARKILEKTVLAHKEAVSAIKIHNAKLRRAMELDSSNILEKENEWKSVTEAYNIKKKYIEEAETLLVDTKAVIEKIELQVDDGKSNTLTKKNKVLAEAIGQVSKFNYELDSIREELKKTVTDDNILKEYHDLVTASKKQFRDEVEAVTPGLRISRKLWEKMSLDEMHLLLAHSYRRVQQLQEQLAQQQVTEVLRIEEALDKQKLSNNNTTKAAVDRERELLLKEQEREKENWMIDAGVQFENELREQLNRQATIHGDHMAEILKLQKKEIESEYNEILKEQLQKARDDFDLTVAASIGRLRGIEEAVESRSNVEEAARYAQKLWIACQSLVTAVDQPDAEPRPLQPDMDAIRSASKSHPFVQHILASVTGGPVRNENEIRSRFNKVKKICKRVAMIDETGGTLWEYFVSFVQSLFVISAAKPMELDQRIDISKISTFVILDNAKHYMEKGDLETALKFMNQLRGEARHVASDWIKDTRKLLEARQAARVLLAFASAAGVAAKV